MRPISPGLPAAPVLGRVLGLSLGLALAVAGAAQADGLVFSKKNRGALFKSQTALLDGRLSDQYGASERITPHAKAAKNEAGADNASASSVRYRGKYKGEYLDIARAAARKHGVPEEMFLRLVHQESGWNSGAVSPKGATGLAQLMPETAQLLGVDINDPGQNLEGGARYLKMMYDRFGSWKLALAAYNAGPIAVEKNNGIPPYEETKNYVAAILVE